MVYTSYAPTSLQDSITSICKTILPFPSKKRRIPAIEQRLSDEQSDNLKWQQNSFHQMLNLMGLCKEGIVSRNEVSAFRIHLLETLIASPVDHEPPLILRDKLIFLQELLYAKCISDEEYHASKRPLLQRLAVQGAEIDVRNVIVGGKKEASNDEWSEIDLKDEDREFVSTSKSISKGSSAVKRMKGAASVFGFVSSDKGEGLKEDEVDNRFLNGGSDERGNGLKSILMEESLQSPACVVGEKKNGGGKGMKATLRAAMEREREKVKLGKRGWGFNGFKKWRKNESKDGEIAPSSSPEESYGGKLVSNPVGEGPDTRQIKRKLHPNGAPTDFFVDKVVAKNIKKQLSRIRTEIFATDSNARLTDEEIEAISTKLPIDKADLNKLFPRSWCDQYGDVVLDVVRKEFKEHMREMGNQRGKRDNKFEDEENSNPNHASINSSSSSSSSSSIDKGFKYNPFFDM